MGAGGEMYAHTQALSIEAPSQLTKVVNLHDRYMTIQQ